MRRPLAVLFTSATAVGFWLGCNAILGNEAAVFAPEVDGPDTSVDDTGTPKDDRFAPDAVADAVADATPCTDTVTDPKHCGACGHDCLGGACAGGVCQPVTLASDEAEPDAIAVNTTHVYWSNSMTGDIRRVPIAGGTSELVYDGPSNTRPGHEIVVVGDDVYLALRDRIAKCPGAGCPPGGPASVVTGLTDVNVVSVSGNTLLFTESRREGTVGACDLPCNDTPLLLAGEDFPLRIAASDNVWAWSTLFPPAGAVRVRIGSLPPATIASDAFAQGIAIAGSDVIYMSRGEGPIAVPLDGGPRRRLSRTATDAEFIAVDKTTVFYAHEVIVGGAIYRCEVAGCGDGGVTLARDQVRPRGIAVDAKSVYWANAGSGAGGAIMRVAR